MIIMVDYFTIDEGKKNNQRIISFHFSKITLMKNIRSTSIAFNVVLSRVGSALVPT